MEGPDPELFALKVLVGEEGPHPELFWCVCPAAGLERPVYIGLEFHWTPGLFGTANSHWLASHLHSGKAGTLPSASPMWGRWSLEAAGSLLLELLELLRADWPSAHLESMNYS